jgi:hypothetical protein
MKEHHSMDKHPERENHFSESEKVPFVIKLAWTVLITWSMIYFIKWAWPDLLIWTK